MSAAEFSGRKAEIGSESFGKMITVGISAIFGDLFNGTQGVTQKDRGVFHAEHDKILPGRPVHLFFEKLIKFVDPQPRKAAEAAIVNRGVDVFIHKVDHFTDPGINGFLCVGKTILRRDL